MPDILFGTRSHRLMGVTNLVTSRSCGYPRGLILPGRPGSPALDLRVRLLVMKPSAAMLLSDLGES